MRISSGQLGIFTPSCRDAAIAAAVIIYLLFFLFVELPGLPDDPRTGQPVRRVQILSVALLPETIVRNWANGRTAFLDRLPILIVCSVIVGLAFLIGRPILIWGGLCRQFDRLETVVIGTGLGLAMISTYSLCVGLLGFLQYRSAYLIPAGTVLIAFALRCATRIKIRSGKKAESKGEHGNLQYRFFALAFIAICAVYVLGGILPPVEFDVREYHLQVPKEWYLNGRITFLSHNVYGNMPLGAEVLALPAMAVLGDWWQGALAGKLLISLFAPLGALTVFAAGRRIISSFAGNVAALLYLTMPWVSMVSLNGLVEGVWACYLIQACYPLLVYWQDRCSSNTSTFKLAGVSGLLAGASAACKYPAVPFVVCPLLLAWIWLIPKRGSGNLGASVQDEATSNSARTVKSHAPGNGLNNATIASVKNPALSLSRLRDALCYAAVAKASRAFIIFFVSVAILSGIWYAKNAAFTGNPVHPLLTSVFGSGDRPSALIQRWKTAHQPPNYNIWDFGRRMESLALRSEWHSPGLVPLAVIGGFSCWWNRFVRAFLCYVIFFVVGWWLLTHRIERFLVPILPVVTVIAGCGADWISRNSTRGLVTALLVFTTLHWFVFVTSGLAADSRYFVALDALKQDADRVDPWHEYLNREVPPGTRVLMVGDARAFDLEVGVLYNTVFDESIAERLLKGKSPEETRRILADNRISYIYVHWGEIARYRSPGNYGFTDFVKPEVFERLAKMGVLELMPPLADHPGRVYRVKMK